MARPESIAIVRHVPLKDLDREIELAARSAASAARIRGRLTFIRMRYLGYSVPEASAAVGMSAPTGYSVQRAWNEGGPEALAPRFGGGRRPRLTSGQKAELVGLLREEPRDTGGARDLIAERFKVDYTLKQVHVILTSLGLRHAKPYPRDRRRPADAEGILKKGSRMVWSAQDPTS